jgi:TRAP-type C4-dicarboxylate transport system permease small subunit
MLSKIGKWYSEVFLYKVTLWLTILARISLIIMMIVTFAMVVFRKLFVALGWRMGPGISGAYEWTEVFMVVLAVCAVAYTWYTGGHIRIGLLRDSLRVRLKAIWDAVVALIGAAYMAIVVWGVYLQFEHQVSTHMMTPIARIPLPPFAMIAVIFLAHFCLVLLRSVIGLFSKGMGKDFAQEPYLEGQ